MQQKHVCGEFPFVSHEMPRFSRFDDSTNELVLLNGLRRMTFQIRWCSIAKRVAALRDATSNFLKIELIWVLTVLGLMISFSAI